MGKMTIGEARGAITSAWSDAATMSWTFHTDGTVTIDPPGPNDVKVTDVKITYDNPHEESDELVFEGTFQGRWYIVSMDIIGGDSPIASVMSKVLGLSEGDEVLSVLIRRKDGTIEVVPHGN